MFKSTFLIVLSLVIGVTVTAQKSIKQEVRKIIKYDTNLEYGKTKGFKIAIIDGDTSFVFSIGHTTNDSMNLFELGSVTKAITASLVSKLVEKGYFKLEDSVNDYLPASFANPRMENLKIKDLLEHTSGLPKKPNDFGTKEIHIQNPYANYTKFDLLRFYRDYLPRKKEKKEYLYAHTNYALLEIVIENAAQESYENLVTKEIFKPYGMNDSYISLSEQVQEELVDAYDRSSEKVYPWTFKSFAASNGIKASIEDIVSFVNVNITDDCFDGNHKKRIKTNLNDHIYSGRGWHILVQEAPYDIISLSGKTSGHHVITAFIKETKTAVIVMTNSALGSDNLAFLILRMINNNWTRDANNKS